MPARRNPVALLVLLCMPLAVSACGSASKAVANGEILRMVSVKNPIFPASVPAGYTLYNLTYESEGQPVQAYLGVPPGKGPFQLLVDLHGGSAVALNGPSRSSGVSTASAADHVFPALVVLIPNYSGYLPSPGKVQDGYHDYLDALNGLIALRHVRSLHIAPHDTYLSGTSLGGFVALRLAEADPDVRAAGLTSPWPGMNTSRAWLKTHVGDGARYRNAYATFRSYGGAKPDPWLNRNSVQLSDVHVPILIIGGTEDTTMPPDLLRYLDQHLAGTDPHVTLTFIPGGHAPLGTEANQDFDTFMNQQGLSMVVAEP